MKYLLLIILIVFAGFNFLVYTELKDLKSKINTSNEDELTHINLFNSQNSKINVLDTLIKEVETFIKKNKVPAIE